MVPAALWQILHWLKYFNREQLLVIAQEDLLRRPAFTVAQVFKHVWLPEFDVSHITDSDIASM